MTSLALIVAKLTWKRQLNSTETIRWIHNTTLPRHIISYKSITFWQFLINTGYPNYQNIPWKRTRDKITSCQGTISLRYQTILKHLHQPYRQLTSSQSRLKSWSQFLTGLLLHLPWTSGKCSIFPFYSLTRSTCIKKFHQSVDLPNFDV